MNELFDSLKRDPLICQGPHLKDLVEVLLLVAGMLTVPFVPVDQTQLDVIPDRAKGYIGERAELLQRKSAFHGFILQLYCQMTTVKRKTN